VKIKNTFTSWQNANKVLLSSETEESEITVNLDGLSDTGGDVLNLCYLYPLAYSLFIRGKISAQQKLKVNICLPNNIDQVQLRAQTGRINIFLRMMQLKEYIELKIASKPLFYAALDDLPELSDAGRIFPLYEATANFDESQQPLVSSYHLFRRSLSELQEYSESSRFPFLKIVQAMYRFIENTADYEGTKKYPVSAANKEELHKRLTSEVEVWSKEISILALAIWLMLLRDLVKTKQLFVPYKEGKTTINENVLTKSRMDAITYGEAMYQLIENACLHSDGKRAWFGFRMHRFSDDPFESRDHVVNRYSSCFLKEKPGGFDNDVPCLFEFFVIDSAYCQEGVTGHYNETVFQAIRDPVYKKVREIDPGFVLPQNRREPVVSDPKWKRAETDVLTDNPLQRTYIDHVNDLFNLKPRMDEKKDYIEDLSEHYGLRLLRKIVSVNGGYLQGISPYGTAKTQFYYDGKADTDLKTDSYVTIWSVLLPLQYNWAGWSPKDDKKPTIAVLDDPTVPIRKCLMRLNADALFPHPEVGISHQNRTKFDDIEVCRKSLAQYLQKSNKDLTRAVLVLEPGETLYKLEILIKSLFCQLVDLLYKNDEKIPLRIAILLPSLSRVHEFVRLFSILYYDDKLSIMRSVQIALCVKSNHPVEPIYIACLLAEETLSMTYKIAQLFTYHYPEHTFQSLPILSYLIPQPSESEDSTGLNPDVSLFPFDLFLSKNLPSSSGFYEMGEIWESNVFLDRTERILCTDIREPSYGCLIRDVHVRLGSKIHLDRFYEAELLFHDTGNIARFAYILVQDLLYGPNKLTQNESVLLLGYEKYSAPLMMQIERWLNKSDTFSFVCTAIIHDFGEQKKEVQFHLLSKPGIQGITATTQVVSVVPVGTTLSTIYKLHNTARLEYPNLETNAFTHNYSIVLIGNQADEGSLAPVTQRFWKNIQVLKHLVTVQPECYDGMSVSVRYLTRVNANWYSPEECDMCKNDSDPLPLLDVKHAETLPAAIFLQKSSRQSGFYDLVESRETNRERLNALLNHVYYSHICSGNNHFQFYIDFQRLFADNAEAINQYFKTVNVDTNAFHVLVSPLQISNSSIADAVIREVFRGCSRFLYFNIADAYREEVRTKFSHVTQDYLMLRRYNPNAKLHIHYVDNSIINGSLISRARILMKMLMTQSGLDDSHVILFEHIFLLVNRSAFDTINSYVQFPKEKLHAYIYLSFPSYNTENDICPACRLVEKYRLLRKRSSSEMLDLEFSRLIKKHTKRTTQEYRDSLTNDILHSPSYFGWVRQWLHINVTDRQIFSIVSLQDVKNEKQIERDLQDIQVAQKLKNRIDEYLKPLFQDEGKHEEVSSHPCRVQDEAEKSKIYGHQQKILHKLSDVSLSDVLDASGKDDSFDKSVVDLVQRRLVGPRDYMRLYSMETAYEALEDPKLVTDDASHQTYYQTILKLMDKKLVNMDQRGKIGGAENLNSEQRKHLVFVYNAEWLISYIKVLSRAQLSNHYVYRRAIVSIISTIITLIATPKSQFLSRCEKLKKAFSHWSKILDTLKYALGYSSNQDSDEIYPLICYQLNITLIHRICDLQLHWLITANNVESYVNLYMDCLERVFKQEGKDIQINFPTERAAILRYMKALKTATMSSEDDIPCIKLADILNHLSKSNLPTRMRYNMLMALSRFIEVENSRMLYSGMDDLEKKVSSMKFPTNLSDYRPSEGFYSVITKLDSLVMENLRICYGGTNRVYDESYLLYQNYLSNFCRFWHRASKKSPYAALPPDCSNRDTELRIGQVSYMLQYFLRLRSLSSAQHGTDQISSIPYAYEELCRTICGLSGFDMCYIVFRGAGRLPEIIAQSGYYAPYMEKQKILTVIEIDEILINFRNDSEKSFFSCLSAESSPREDAVFFLPCVLSYQKEDRQVLILELAIHDGQHGDDHFYIILQNEKGGSKIKAENGLPIARNILFMRFTLLEILTRDYALLANFRYDCSYIRPLNQKKGLPVPKILHLSDLHVDQDNVDKLVSMIKSKLTKAFRDKYPIDLLIISGDIADGSGANASVMEERYRCVERLLNAIVMCLWQDTMAYLSHDWRRRVVITTGNHDYASMNQYNAQLDMRTLVSGTPVKEETGTMSKFSYFIHFLIRYLDPPINEFLSNDLNEVRNYRYLNLKLLCLNCSSRATPYRTNKLGVDQAIVLGLTKRAMWAEKNGVSSKETISMTPAEPNRICVAHYSPRYDLSYFRDNYKTLPGWEWTPHMNSPINELEELFRVILLKEQSLRVDPEKDDHWKASFQKDENDFLKMYQSMMNAIHALQEGNPCPDADAQPFYDQLKNKMPAIKDPEKKYRLLRYMRQFSQWIGAKNKNEQDENMAQFLKEAADHILMGKTDSNCYANLIREIHKEHPLTVILAGHIHAYAEEKLEPLVGNENGNGAVPILVSDRLYNQSNSDDLNGYLIEFASSPDDPRPYQHRRLSNDNL